MRKRAKSKAVLKDSNECIVYLDSFVKKGKGIYDVFVDFRSKKDVALFSDATGFVDSGSTFIEIRSLKATKRLIEGRYYKLNLDFFKSRRIMQVDSCIIGGAYDFKDMLPPKGENEEILQKHERLDSKQMSFRNEPNEPAISDFQHDDLKLFVKDVGQANWNELRKGDTVVAVFDAGAPTLAKKADVERILKSRIVALNHSKPILIISHWDKDHIHCLKLLSETEIRDCFSKLICVDKLMSKTSTEIITHFKKALGASNIYCLPVPAKTKGVLMHPWQTNGVISIYRGEIRRSINFCGLVMFVKGINRSANYTGDCLLNQAKDVYDQELSKGLGLAEHVLIAPHHGGDYGSSFRHYSRPCSLIEISVGVNSYGHPDGKMEKYLKSLGTVKSTLTKGDIIENL